MTMELEHLIVKNLPWLRVKAARYCSNLLDAEDLVGDTIERLLMSRERFNTLRDFKPWAMAIMCNLFITQYNRKLCVPFVGLDSAYACASERSADHCEAVHHILSALRKCARQSIAIECVILYAKGYTYKEIAAMLNLPIGTVMSRISNGRKMLQRALDG